MDANDDSRRRRKRQLAKPRDAGERISLLVRSGQYHLSEHVVNEKIAPNDYLVEDIEDSILSGSIVKSERDEVGVSVDGKKYTILGQTRDGLSLYTVGKIVRDDEGELYFVITIY